RKGMAAGLVPPKSLIEKVVHQADAMAASELDASPFGVPLTRFPETVPPAAQRHLRDEFASAFKDAVKPAYGNLSEFVRQEYDRRARTDSGVWSLPDGEERYAADVRRATTTHLTPAQIHAIGVEQVADVEE